MFNSPSSRGGRRRLHVQDYVRAGLIPKLDNNSLHFLNGQGQFSTPASGSGDWIKLAQVVAAGSPSTIDFSSIPGAYSALRVSWIAQDNSADTALHALMLKVNGDATSGNYTNSQRAMASAGAVLVTTFTSTSAGAFVGYLTGTNDTNKGSTGEVILVGYANTAFHKILLAILGIDNTSNNGTTGTSESRWKSTAAINQLTFSSATTFVTGSTFTLYGIN